MRYFWCELAIVSAFMITFAVEFNSLTIINIRTMVNYKDLGLVNTRDMFAKAIKGGYAIPAFNFNNMEQMQAIIKAAVETKSPVILQVSKGARQYANATLLRYMAQGAVEYAKELGCAKPEIVLHLDHGDTFETCKSCIDSGFSSVMIDGSHLPYEENVALTKKVVDYAHQFDVTVEGELGVLAGVEDEVSSDHHTYTDPEEVIDFATRTGCDSLAISIGTSHGAYKFTPEQCHIDPATGRMVPPPLAFEVLDAVMEKLPGFPIVLHGSSSVPQEEVETINKYGGLQVSFQAFKNATKDAPLPVKDGFTPEQRFFLSYAGVWAGNIRDEQIRLQTKSDPHSLGRWRVNGALPQIGAWYDAFGIKEGDPMYLAPEKRVSIW